MGNKAKFFCLFIITELLMLSGCSAQNENSVNESIDCQLAEEDESTPEPEEESGDNEIWKSKFYVTEEQLQGNILGYSLKRDQTMHMWYEQDMPYILEEAVVGKGVFRSEYLCETEVFIGSLIKDLLISRGELKDGQKQYFTEWAIRQLTEINWEALEKQWKPDLYSYDRYYRLNSALGRSDYRFTYVFYADQEDIQEEEVNYVSMTFSVNSEGEIYEIKANIVKDSAERPGMENTVNTTGIFDDEFQENVIQDGKVKRDKILLDFEKYFKRFMYPDEVYEQSDNGLLTSGDAAQSAENIGNIFIDVLEAGGANAYQYEEWFSYDTDFSEFADNPWDELEENWTAAKEYDCFYIDRIDIGYVGFQYYFYPDYDVMGVDEAKTVMISCNVDVAMGKLEDTDIRLFPMTRQEYQKVKETDAAEAQNTIVVEKGQKMYGRENVILPLPQKELTFMPIEEFVTNACFEDQYEREKKYELWGYSDASEIAGHLGELILEDIENQAVESGNIAELQSDKVDAWWLYTINKYAKSEDWSIDKNYDCFYIKENESARAIHLKYYFNMDHNSGDKKVMVIDIYVSEKGIEYMRVDEFRTGLY